jgi:hypothetical protein
LAATPIVSLNCAKLNCGYITVIMRRDSVKMNFINVVSIDLSRLKSKQFKFSFAIGLNNVDLLTGKKQLLSGGLSKNAGIPGFVACLLWAKKRRPMKPAILLPVF